MPEKYSCNIYKNIECLVFLNQQCLELKFKNIVDMI